MKALLALFILINSTYASELIIYDIEHKQFLSKEEFLEDNANSDSFLFGEIHYHKCIQQAESEVINWIAKDRSQDFTVGMEFVNYDMQAETDHWSEEYLTGAIGLRTYTQKLIGKRDQDLRYSPILRETILNNGQLLGTNSPRDIKSKLIKSGYDSIPEEYKVKEFFEGSLSYYQRFKKAMEGHANEEQIQKYFNAQVYTDNYIAEKFLNKRKHLLSIQIIGSFHTDYLDGVISQLKNRSDEKITSIKFLEMKDMYEYLKPDTRFGKVANYLFGCKAN